MARWKHGDVDEEGEFWNGKLEPFRRRHLYATERTSNEIATLKQLFGQDIVPPATASGVLWHIRLMAFLAGWLAAGLLVAGIAASFLPTFLGGLVAGGSFSLACSYEAMVLQWSAIVVSMLFAVYLSLGQGWAFLGLQEVTERLDRAVPLPPAEELAQLWGQDDSPLLVDPTLTEVGYVLPTMLCGCGPQVGGHYELQGYGWRLPVPGRHQSTSAALMRHYYWTEFLQGRQLLSAGASLMLSGALQAAELLLVCAQPGLMRGLPTELQEDSTFLQILHGGWATAGTILFFGLVQAMNCRHLLRNALGAATAEKEWLAFDVVGMAQDGPPSWQYSIGVVGAQRFAEGQEDLGHLNLTYAWMSLEAAAEVCGAFHLAAVARGVALSTQKMVEENTPYRFRLRGFAEWDLKKVGLVSRVLQCFLLTALNVEYFGASYCRGCVSEQVFTLACIGLTLLTVIMKAWNAFGFMALGRVMDPDPGYTYPGLYKRRVAPDVLGCRAVGSRAVVSFTMLVALLTVMVAVLGAYVFLGPCRRGGFSLVESVRLGQWRCRPNYFYWDGLEGQLWRPEDDHAWLAGSGVALGIVWVWLAYWSWWAGMK